MTAAYRLGVDFGTSTTVAMLQQPDGRTRPLLFDGSPLLSSAVLLGSDGKLHTGRDAAHLARGNPEGLEPNPKRRIDEGTVLLGTAEIRVRDLLAAVFERVAAEARQVGGGAGELVLTHPAGWGPGRRSLLAQAAQQAGLSPAQLVSEPVAAATYFAHGQAAALPTGASVLVYDLGAGTCDVTLLRRAPHGFDPIATDGLNDVGGLDIDAAIVAFLQATYGGLWTDSAGRRQVWDEVRTGKEMLSRTAATIIAVPTLGKQVPLGREQLELLARPVLRPTVAMAQTLCREAGLDPRAVAGLFLVGGASRTPLVATMLHETLGVAPVATDQPELVVAEGALHVRPAVPLRPSTGTFEVTPRHVSGAPYPVSPAGQPTTGPPFPVSPAALAPGGGPIPVSPPIIPASRPAFPPPMPPPAARRSHLGLGLGLGAAAVVVLLVVLIGGSVALYAWVNTGRPNANDTGRIHPSIDVSLDLSPSVKFPMDSLPDDMCVKVEIGAVAKSFEATDGKPRAERNASTYFGSARCSYDLQHNDGGGTSLAVATLSYGVYLFSSPTAATSAQKDAVDGAKLNKATITDVRGLADTAFASLEKGNPQEPGTDFTVQVQALDGNLQWDVTLTARRVSGTWSDADEAQIETNVIAAAKASYTKYRTP